MTRLRSNREGFTLIELMVALVIGGSVLLACGLLFTGMATTARTTADAEQRSSRWANARRLLRQLCSNVEVGLPGDVPFAGTPSALHMTTWHRVADGWLERQDLHLHHVGDRLVATFGDGGTVTLAEDVRSVGFDYLLSPGAATKWGSGWQSPVSVPLAVRIRLTFAGSIARADTVLLILGERG